MKLGIAASRPPRLTLVALAALVAGSAVGQSTPSTAPRPAAGSAPAPMAAPAPAAVFTIRGFQVEGDNPIGDAEAQRVLAPYARSGATLETLQQATAALETALRERGYGLHRVALPPQELGANVRLNIVKFTVGKVGFEGREIYDEGNIRRTLPELREGESPNFKTLAIQTAIANENPNKQVQVGLRESEQPDKIDATITVKEQRPWTFGASVSNYGTDASGQDRFTVFGGHTNLWNLDHEFVGAYSTSIEQIDDVRQLGLAYKIPLYALGGVVGLSYTNSDVVGNFGAFTSTGAGHTFGASYTMYLAPQGGRRSYVSFALDDKLFEAARINDVVQFGQLDRRSRPVTVGYTARTETDTAVWGYNADFAINTGTGAHNDLNSYRSEDPRVDTVYWKAVHASAFYTGSIFKDWLWNVRGAAQYSPDVLISGEQFGLGGVNSVRGTEIERPISGDSGFSATFELNTPELSPGFRLLTFLDAGMLFNHDPNISKPGTDHLAGVGVGMRFNRGPFVISADYARLIWGSNVPLSVNSASPQSGDERLYVNLALRF